MNTHTPGPWKAEGYDVRQPSGRYIAHTGPHHTPASEYPKSCRLVDEANARLIADAPKMFAALETLRADLLMLRQSNNQPGWKEAIDAVSNILP